MNTDQDRFKIGSSPAVPHESRKRQIVIDLDTGSVVSAFRRTFELAPQPHFATAVVFAWLVVGASAAALAQPMPARIVSTSPSITETLFALGIGDRVVGVSTFCRYPAPAAALPKVGTYLKPDAETIARLKPDLVFVHTGPNSAVSQLAILGIRTAIVDRGGLAGVFTTIRQIGAAAGVADRAERLVGDVNGGLDRVRLSVAGRGRRTVLIIVGRRTGTLSDIVAVGPGSYLNDIAVIAGGTNVLAAAKLEYPRISMETVISLAPDVIVDVGEMGESPADSDRRRRITEGLWQRQTLVKAVRDGGVHATHDEAFVVPGPRIVLVARAMAAWLHGVPFDSGDQGVAQGSPFDAGGSASRSGRGRR